MSDSLSVPENVVFVSYSHEDRTSAQRLYYDLRSAGIPVWIDFHDLPLGVDFDVYLTNVISKSSLVLLLLSRTAISRSGFQQKELRQAIELIRRNPPLKPSVIPVRLDDCEPQHPELKRLNRVDMFPSWEEGLTRLLRWLRASARDIHDYLIKILPRRSSEGQPFKGPIVYALHALREGCDLSRLREACGLSSSDTDSLNEKFLHDLDTLELRGIVEHEENPDGTVLYRLTGIARNMIPSLSSYVSRKRSV